MSEEMREGFEEFCKLNLFVSLDVDGDGNFSNRETKDKFILWRLAWKASREAMKPIKLPDATFETPSGDSAFREYAVIEAIQQAGYKVAE